MRVATQRKVRSERNRKRKDKITEGQTREETRDKRQHKTIEERIGGTRRRTYFGYRVAVIRAFLRGLRLRVATQRKERSERIRKRKAKITEGQTREERRKKDQKELGKGRLR